MEHVVSSFGGDDCHWEQDSPVVHESANDVLSCKGTVGGGVTFPSRMNLSHSFVIKGLSTGNGLVDARDCCEGGI